MTQPVSMLSVQELTKEPIISVPERYVLSNQNNPNAQEYFPDGPSQQLPTIDLKLLVSADTAESELEKLDESLKEWGFFQLVNHGVKRSCMEKLRHEVEEFYKLPLEEKMKYKPRADEYEGYGNIARSDGTFDWGDRIYMQTNPIHMRKQYLIPQFSPSLRNAMETYLQEMQKLSLKLFVSIAKALKIDTKVAEEMVDDGMQSVRMTYYPPCPQPESVAGIRPHSDGSMITVVNQINGVDGLQIKKNGAWLPVSFLPDALVVNTGDILEILSNGKYNSVEHCVRVNPEKERMSIAFFYNPNMKAEVGPATALINPSNPPRFRRVEMQQYLNEFYSRCLKGKTYLEYMMVNQNQDAHNLGT